MKIKHNAFDYLSSFFDIEEIVKKIIFSVIKKGVYMKIETKQFYITFKNEWFIDNDYNITLEITRNSIVFQSKSKANMFIDKFNLKFQNFLNNLNLECLNNKNVKFLSTPSLILYNFMKLNYVMQYMFLKLLQEYRKSKYNDFTCFIKKNKFECLTIHEQILEIIIFA